MSDPFPARATPDEARAIVAALRSRGPVVGTDEAGRGPLAGPVVAAAVCLTGEQEDALLSMGLRDSKRMSARARERVFGAMMEMGAPLRAQAASVERIEREDVLRASLWAMGRSVARLCEAMSARAACVIVDGPARVPGLDAAQWPLIGADAASPVVAAASVVAKVLRDRIMTALDPLWPGYGLAQHKGYPTAAHRAALSELGPSPIHRRSFCRKILVGKEGMGHAPDR
ncbi:MAG: ribonuclease HII [Synergistaceae bacterium]|nr:ribonuclease HII [Synergistaceae bacterium]